jgi:hypothetical protein
MEGEFPVDYSMFRYWDAAPQVTFTFPRPMQPDYWPHPFSTGQSGEPWSFTAGYAPGTGTQPLPLGGVRFTQAYNIADITDDNGVVQIPHDGLLVRNAASDSDAHGLRIFAARGPQMPPSSTEGEGSAATWNMPFWAIGPFENPIYRIEML